MDEVWPMPMSSWFAMSCGRIWKPWPREPLREEESGGLRPGPATCPRSGTG
jgi:hypothetical protein